MEKIENKKMTRVLEGRVVGTVMMKTITVLVESVKTNLKYKRKFKTTKKFPVHDETGLAKVGDLVRFMECRPLSKTKRWRIQEVVKK
ncbi:MAG TPA: 30S ribosomal protein S17 [Patescibacteria group bacterium]|nr:30S ribosomal protein S17 [Patescibacteria group bacterium]